MLLHLLGIIYLWQSQPLPKFPETIEVTLQQKDTSIKRVVFVAESARIENKEKKSSSARSSSELGQKILSKFSKPNFKSAISAKDSEGLSRTDAENYALHPLDDDPLADWGTGGGTFARTRDNLLFQQIYRSVDEDLYYTSVLFSHRIESIINSRMVLDETGHCQWRFMKITGASPYLRLYVLDTMKKVCQQNFSRFINDRRLTNVDLSFKFELSEHNSEDLKAEQKFIVGNALLFYRNKQTSIMEWDLGPFHGLFPVPVVYLNTAWIQENWEELHSHKDPLDLFKRQFGSDL